MRLFVAFEVGEEIRARLTELGRELAAVAPSARWVKPEKMHVTLAFLGEQPKARAGELAAAIAGACARHRALVLRAVGGGAFGSPRRPKVLWLGLEGDTGALAALQGELAKALAPFGYVNEHGRYAAHLTLARAKMPRGDAQLAACAERLKAVDLGQLAVTEVLLVESQGGQYTAVSRSPLPTGEG